MGKSPWHLFFNPSSRIYVNLPGKSILPPLCRSVLCTLANAQTESASAGPVCQQTWLCSGTPGESQR